MPLQNHIHFTRDKLAPKKEPEKKDVLAFADSLDKKKPKPQKKGPSINYKDVMKRLKGGNAMPVNEPARGAKRGSKGRGGKVIGRGRANRSDDDGNEFSSEGDVNQEYNDAALQDLGAHESDVENVIEQSEHVIDYDDLDEEEIAKYVPSEDEPKPN